MQLIKKKLSYCCSYTARLIHAPIVLHVPSFTRLREQHDEQSSAEKKLNWQGPLRQNQCVRTYVALYAVPPPKKQTTELLSNVESAGSLIIVVKLKFIGVFSNNSSADPALHQLQLSAARTRSFFELSS